MSTDDYADNGDYLTPTAGGEVVILGSDASEQLGVITNSGSSLVLGFLVSDFDTRDADSDGTEDIVEVFTNMLLWFRDS